MSDFNIDDQPTEVQVWFRCLPEIVQPRVLEYPPGEKYLLGPSGAVVRLLAYSEGENDNGDPICDQCQVSISQEDNAGKLHIERRVFGINFSDLGPVPPGYEPPGDRPLEDMEPEFRKIVEETIKERTV